MNRYVIVNLFDGEVLKFHNEIVRSVCETFDVRPQKLPAHFTIKSPFEVADISEIEKLTDEFIKGKNQKNLNILGFNHFRDNVIYMEILPSDGLRELSRNYQTVLRSVDNLSWSENENEIVFHCTIVSKKIRKKFTQIYEYVNKFNCKFDEKFDNITIMKWNEESKIWNIYRRFDF
jgi:2'-5' RNA ligase